MRDGPHPRCANAKADCGQATSQWILGTMGAARACRGGPVVHRTAECWRLGAADNVCARDAAASLVVPQCNKPRSPSGQRSRCGATAIGVSAQAKSRQSVPSSPSSLAPSSPSVRGPLPLLLPSPSFFRTPSPVAKAMPLLCLVPLAQSVTGRRGTATPKPPQQRLPA